MGVYEKAQNEIECFYEILEQKGLMNKSHIQKEIIPNKLIVKNTRAIIEQNKPGSWILKKSMLEILDESESDSYPEWNDAIEYIRKKIQKA